MTKIEEICTREQEAYNAHRNYRTLERYVMSELISPIENYANAAKLIRENFDLLTDYNLVFIGSYITSLYTHDRNIFLEILNSRIGRMNAREKAITYYLKALEAGTPGKKFNALYINYLKRSVEYSYGIDFVNNYYDLAETMKGKQADSLYHTALLNIEKIETEDILHSKSVDYWLSSQHYVNEFILGTYIKQDTYKQKMGKIK